MNKEAVEAAIGALEGSIRSIDTWVLIFAAVVAIGLTLEVVFSVAHWLKDRQLPPLRLELARLNAIEFTALTERAANAEKGASLAKSEAANAQLALEKFKAPRELSAENRVALIERMSAFSGTIFDAGITAPDPEYILLIRDVIGALKKAGWIFVGWEGPGQLLHNAPDPVIGMVSVAGIAIFVNPEADPELWKPVSALTSFFNDVELKANSGRMAVSGNTNAKAIHVMIGRKL